MKKADGLFKAAVRRSVCFVHNITDLCHLQPKFVCSGAEVNNIFSQSVLREIIVIVCVLFRVPAEKHAYPRCFYAILSILHVLEARIDTVLRSALRPARYYHCEFSDVT